jgi:hypothetical protein
MKPLEYFRGERVVYGRRESGRFPCPVEVRVWAGRVRARKVRARGSRAASRAPSR